MKKIVALSVALCMSMGIAAQGTGAAGAQAQAKYSPRGQLVYKIVEKWAPHVSEAYGVSPAQWAKQMGPEFNKASDSALQVAADSRTYDAMNNALRGKMAVSKDAMEAPKALGDLAADLVFVPIAPCRLFDTRLAGGAIAANTTRGFDVTAVSDYSFQGGSASNCNGTGAAGSFAAAAINFTVVTPANGGYITAFPFGGTQPLAATLNYNVGDIRGNLSIVALDQGASANELNVYSTAQTHLVADIVGYFINPAVTALQCTEVESAAQNFAAGAANNVFAPACPSTYTAVEIQCRPSSFGMRVAGSWSSHCNFVNDSASAATAIAAARCCRVPGR